MSEMYEGYSLLAEGKLEDYNDNFGFCSHPTGYGPMTDFTGFALSATFTKFLLPAGLAFSEKLPFQGEIYDLLLARGGYWYLLFDFVEKNPFLIIDVGIFDVEIKTLGIGILSDDKGEDFWVCRYGTETDRVMHRYEIKEWAVPEYLDGLLISVIDVEAQYGSEFC